MAIALDEAGSKITTKYIRHSVPMDLNAVKEHQANS